MTVLAGNEESSEAFRFCHFTAFAYHDDNGLAIDDLGNGYDRSGQMVKTRSDYIQEHPFLASTEARHIGATIGKLKGEVTADDICGFVGSTGNSTGPHLHLEAYKNFLGREIHDPMTFLASKTTTERCDSEVRTLEIIWRRNAAGELKLAITSKNPQPSEDSETTPRKAVIYVDGEKTAENLTFAQGSTTESDENVEVFLAEMDYIPNLSSKHFSIEVHGLVNGKVVAAGIAMIPSSVANEPAVFVRQVIPNDPNNATFAIGLEGLKPDGAEGIAAYADGCGAKQGLGCLLNPKEDGSDVRTGGTWFSTRASTSAAPTTPENNAVEVRATFNETSRRRTLGARAVLTGESIPEGQALPSDKPQLKNISLKPSYLHGVSQTGTDPTVPSGK